MVASIFAASQFFGVGPGSVLIDPREAVLDMNPAFMVEIRPDNGTLFVERTGAGATTPAVVDGPVGTIKSLSGAVYATAAADGNRAVLRQDGTKYYLEVDGVNDYYTVAPTVDLGSSFWFCGAMRCTTDGRRPFGLSSDSRFVVYNDNAYGWRSYTSAGASGQTVAPGTVTADHILTWQRPSDATANGRFDGVDGSTWDPLNMAGTRGLILFSDRNTGWFNGFAGRFYGGVWNTGTLSVANRAIVEEYVASLGE